MKKISIIGTGNVAYHFCKELSRQNFEIELFGRNTSEMFAFQKAFKLKTLNSISEIDETSLILICVSDDQIQTIVNQLNELSFKAYTSGTVSLTELENKSNLNVFYPLQTFSKNRELDFQNIPILIEAFNKEQENELINLAKKLSSQVELANSEKRKKLHLAAVFANNFTNHLLYTSKNILSREEINWNLLMPLITETFEKIKLGFEPKEIQTGPAKRGDIETIQKQLEQLNLFEKNMYQSITASIIETYKK
jgi:predicted short-subunit dehydrogenase-like oxidoreductase (DUF2520 family)